MKLTLIDAVAAHLVNGGSKAKQDVTAIARKAGVQIVPLRRQSRIATLATLARLAVLALSPRRGLLVNFPVYQASQRAMVRRLSRFHDIIYVIHDIDQERHVTPTQDLADLALSPLSIMSGKLNVAPAAKGFIGPVVAMECWDYLLASPPPAFGPGERVMFAGTLSPDKSPWLYAAGRSLPLTLAGIGLDEARMGERDLFIGPFNPNAPDTVSHGWGLVWDGTAIDDLAGDTGLYQKYNQPHKFSLYLAQNMPIICHRSAAVASFVRDYNVGLVVDSLNDVPAAISALAPSDLAAIEAGVLNVGQRIRSGYYLNRCLDDIKARAVIARPAPRAASQ